MTQFLTLKWGATAQAGVRNTDKGCGVVKAEMTCPWGVCECFVGAVALVLCIVEWMELCYRQKRGRDKLFKGVFIITRLQNTIITMFFSWRTWAVFLFWGDDNIQA